MNFNTVVSAIAASDLSGQEGVLLKLTSTGVDIAGASDRVIGTLVRGAIAGGAVAVFLRNSNGLAYAQVGSATAIAAGDLLDQGANGTVVEHASGTPVAIAWESAPSGSNGAGSGPNGETNVAGQIRVLFL